MRITWEKPRRAETLVAFGVVGLLALVLAACLPVDRMLEAAGHRCPMKYLTGYPCASCGSTRAFVAAGRLELGRAFRLNPLATVMFLFLGVASPWALLAAAFRLPVPRLRGWSTAARLTAAALIVAAILANWTFLLLRTPPT
jgi:hypothetical protein